MKPLYFLAFLITLTVSLSKAEPADTGYVTVHNFKHDLYTPHSEEQWVPYTKQKGLEEPVIGFHVNINEYKNAYLALNISQSTSLLINQRYFDKVEKTGWWHISIDSLSGKFSKNEVFISAFHPDGKFENFQAKIVSSPPQEKKSSQHIKALSAGSNYFNFFVTGFLIILILYAFIINRFPKYKEVFTISGLFVYKRRDENILLNELNSLPNIVFLIFHALLIGFLLVTIQGLHPVFNKAFILINNNNLWSLIGEWLYYSFVVFIGILVKYILLGMVNALFMLKEWKGIHLYDFYRLSVIYGVLTFIVISGAYLGNITNDWNFLNIVINVLIILGAVRVIFLMVKLFNISGLRNIYLFSYLCTTEIIPFVIIAKYLVK